MHFDALLPGILPMAVTCPEPTAIAAIRDALKELCEECRVWPVDDVFVLSPENPEIIFVPPQTLLVEVDEVVCDGRALEPKTLDWIIDNLDDWKCAVGSPAYYTQSQQNTLIITPREPGAKVRIRAYLKPSPRANAAPDKLLDEHYQTLCSGALGKILAIPNQPFSNPQVAAYQVGLFEASKSRISYKFQSGQQRAPLRSKAQFF